MLFNSWQFFIFFGLVFLLYHSLKHKSQNRMLLIASYIFYGAWDWRFLGLIFISTFVDYCCSLKINSSDSPKQRKLLLFTSIFVNLAILGFFKYFNFFTANLENLFGQFGFQPGWPLLKIILPVGISFYTFQTMSYTIDVYRRKIKPTKDFFDFALFVAFFPQLVAGPIERAGRLIKQITTERPAKISQIYQGAYLIIWGLFQKMFIADNLAKIVEPIFSQRGPYNSWLILLGLYAFAFQIYCDFAGYSNIARGTAKCLGFELMVNFNQPYFSTNPRQFWQRWHISLSSWLRDYLYIPLGGNRQGRFKTLRNLMLTMLLGGLWHGAAWTFILWGGYQGAVLILHRLIEPLFKNVKNIKNIFWQKLSWAGRLIFFFHLTCLGWLIFRSQSIGQLSSMLKALFTNLAFSAKIAQTGWRIIFFVWPLFLIEICQYLKKDELFILKTKTIWRIIFYLLLYCLLIMYGVSTAQEFIYFQF